MVGCSRLDEEWCIAMGSFLVYNDGRTVIISPWRLRLDGRRRLAGLDVLPSTRLGGCEGCLRVLWIATTPYYHITYSTCCVTQSNSVSAISGARLVTRRFYTKAQGQTDQPHDSIGGIPIHVDNYQGLWIDI